MRCIKQQIIVSCIADHLCIQCFCSHERIWGSFGSGCKRLGQDGGDKELALCKQTHLLKGGLVLTTKSCHADNKNRKLVFAYDLVIFISSNN